MVDGPIQLVINADRFRDQRIAPFGGGQRKDFFRDDDAGFIEHRTRLAEATEVIRASIAGRPYVNILVKMRADALAKSHRPFAKLFRPSVASHVGTEGYGELIFSMASGSVTSLVQDILSAEDIVQWVEDNRGTPQYAPTAARSEVSAIESILEWVPSRQRGFSIGEAEQWIDSGQGAGLVVDLLEAPHRAEILRPYLRSLPQLERAARDRDVSVTISVPPGVAKARVRAGLPAVLDGNQVDRVTTVASVRESIASIERVQAVKKVRLTDKISDPEGAIDVAEHAVVPRAAPDRRRAIVGVIDGGILGPITDRVVASSNLFAPGHLHLPSIEHATKVASLIARGSWFNPAFLSEAEDCDIYDLTMFPSAAHFREYFGDTEDLLDQLREDVSQAKESHGVRVFNLSWNLSAAPGTGGYSETARRLDRIALDLDVIFVISAGNLETAQLRAEWPADETDVLGMLAISGAPDGLASPAESIANFAVGAVNPDGLVFEIDGAPTRYSRRSTRVPSAVKPDLAAIGGIVPTATSPRSGLRALNSFGNTVDVNGTSYAAPLVARYLATLDAEISGYVSREILVGLAVHHATVPPILKKARVAPLANSFVGYGVPSSVAQTLDGVGHCMTFVLSDVIQPGKRVDFPFTWPASLTLANGKCKGRVRLTLVTRPRLNFAHGDEMVRVNLDASLKQADENGDFQSRSQPTHEFFSGYTYANERALASQLGKWFPIKSYELNMPRGRGVSSDWTLEINYLTRASEAMPDDGLEFALIMSIEDPSGQEPVFDDMRLSLQRTGALLSDLRTAVNVSANV